MIYRHEASFFKRSGRGGSLVRKILKSKNKKRKVNSQKHENQYPWRGWGVGVCSVRSIPLASMSLLISLISLPFITCFQKKCGTNSMINSFFFNVNLRKMSAVKKRWGRGQPPPTPTRCYVPDIPSNPQLKRYTRLCRQYLN